MNRFGYTNIEPTESSSQGTFSNYQIRANEQCLNIEGIKSEHTPSYNNELSDLFPNLVLFFDPYQITKGIKVVNNCLREFNYEELDVNVQQESGHYKANVTYQGQILAVGQGMNKPFALTAAGANLISKIRSAYPTILPKWHYFPKKRVPGHALNPDPTHSNIYKVVCLDKPEGPKFPLKLTGSVDYVHSELDLWGYIQNFLKCGTTSDLYVFNIEPKSGHKKITELCKDKSNVFTRKINGCSNRGTFVYHQESIQKIYHDLMANGGENIKYELVPPGCKLESVSFHKDSNAGDGDDDEGYSNDYAQSDKQDEAAVSQVIGNNDIIDTPPWVSNNLILMDHFKDDGSLECPFEIIFLSVRSASEFREFIVEKKFDRNTQMFTGEALIDRKLVGRARSYSKKGLKHLAAENALKNLKNSCSYIKAKESYIGNKRMLPEFLKNEIPYGTKPTFRIAHPSEASSEKDFGQILLRFRNSNLEELYFLENFSMMDRRLVKSMAKDLRLMVRDIGPGCVCVYKSVRPKDIFKQLVKTGENDKYKLILPAKKASADKHDNEKSQLKTLFDFEASNNLPNDQESNDAKPNLNIQSCSKYSESLKRPFVEGSDNMNEHGQYVSHSPEIDIKVPRLDNHYTSERLQVNSNMNLANQYSNSGQYSHNNANIDEGPSSVNELWKKDKYKWNKSQNNEQFNDRPDQLNVGNSYGQGRKKRKEMRKELKKRMVETQLNSGQNKYHWNSHSQGNRGGNNQWNNMSHQWNKDPQWNASGQNQ